jgi:hypothetical protein
MDIIRKRLTYINILLWVIRPLVRTVQFMGFFFQRRQMYNIWFFSFYFLKLTCNIYIYIYLSIESVRLCQCLDYKVS